MKKLSLVVVACMLSITSATAQKRTALSAEVYGYKQDMNYFDCVQTPTIAAEFHNNPGEEHHYNFTTNLSPILIRINGRTEALMKSGDSLYVVVKREDKNVTATYAGTPSAVEANKLRQEIADIRRRLRYKTQLLACVAVGVKPTERIEGAKELLKQAQEAEQKYKGKADQELLDYIKAEQEASAYMSYMEYPVMFASVRKQSIAEQGIGDYWSIMDGITLRDDNAAMSCPEYASFLMRYCFYQNEKKAVKANVQYETPKTLESMFATLKEFYQGKQRDLTLYTLLTNFIRNGKEIERAIPLYEEYKAMNLNKNYLAVLDHLLQ
ncbi:MAG: hypothetical protein MR536_05385 [Prevotella sp.]|nr:hypothetical protein [Prevotella sp.]MDD7462288.1 hypothetical protein [Prevotellaceae bacterium]MDY3365512.1 hypothetical protein [Prevotella sp.]MDY3852869.1 hypothetical protein [Prevotella sp.]